MPTWPATLPAPLREGYALNPVDPVIRTDMESGAGRARRRTRARNDNVDVAFLLSDAQLVTLRTWYDNDLNGGASWFDIALPVGAGGLTAVQARFKSIWKAVPSGLCWKLTAQLEVR